MKLGIISDIHEDIVSLRKALDILNDKRCDEIICLGDIVGYSKGYYNFFENRNASECLKIVNSECSVVVPGNHDLYAIKKITDFKNGMKYPDNWFELDFVNKKVISGDRVWLYEDEEQENNLTEKDKEFIRDLPEIKIRDYDGLSVLFSHYFYPDISGSESRFRYKRSDLKEHTEFIKKNECLLGISGHVHPDGFLSGTSRRFKWRNYGKHMHKKRLSWILAPCIASSERGSGFMIFNTKTFEIDVIRL